MDIIIFLFGQKIPDISLFQIVIVYRMGIDKTRWCCSRNSDNQLYTKLFQEVWELGSSTWWSLGMVVCLRTYGYQHGGGRVKGTVEYQVSWVSGDPAEQRSKGGRGLGVVGIDSKGVGFLELVGKGNRDCRVQGYEGGGDLGVMEMQGFVGQGHQGVMGSKG